jgi:diguanylate cyclase (GGDEF)-like protein/PAS domain S-box-containing protein
MIVIRELTMKPCGSSPIPQQRDSSFLRIGNRDLAASPMRLLLIDDDPLDRLACRRALEQSAYGFVIHEAGTAEQGLRLVRNESFDCILLDHCLPDLNGLEFLADLVEDSGELPVPVIVLTGAKDATVAMRAFKLGASDYVVKEPAGESLAWVPAVIVRVLRERQTFLEKQEALEQLRLAEAKYRSEAALRASEARFRLLLESAGEGIFGLDAEGRCTFVNQAALDLFGDDAEALLDRELSTMLDRHRSGSEPYPGGQCPLRRTLREGVPSRFTETLLRRDGSSFVAEFSAYPLPSENGAAAGAVIVMRDVSEVRALTEKLSYEASHDALTGLYNRVEFERRVAKLLAASRQDDSGHALCFLDLDRFKAINDTCGHAAGDQLLQSLGLLMESRLRQSDILARLGGDEFGLLLEHCPLEQAWVIANELREAAHGFRFLWGEEEFSVGMSVGIVPLNAASGDVASVLSAADTACYIAKKRGRDRVHILETRGSDTLGESAASSSLKAMEPAWGPESPRPAASGGSLPVRPGAKPDSAERGTGSANLNAVSR